ncbi:hypothetical protein MBLNU459_g2638t2 [Dothideomycetes sp. NU459]
MAADGHRRLPDADVRIVDYMDDKLQSLADFETLDSLLDSVKAQQDLLKKQLSEAQRDHELAQQAAQEHATSVQERGTTFEKEQEDIDRDLMTVTQSHTSDEARRRFEGSMERLRRLDVASGYAEMLKEIDALRYRCRQSSAQMHANCASNECTAQLGKSDKAALDSYSRLQRLVTSLQTLQDAAEGAAPHLIDHVVNTVHSLKGRIQRSFSADFEKTLTEIGWPRATISIPPGLSEEWKINVGRLLDLQKSELVSGETLNREKTSKDEPVALLPLEIMARPLQLRFDYHFSGDRPTNRLDKPEYFLSHVLDLLNSYSSFFQTCLQPLLLSHFRQSDIAFIPAYIDASSALITALLPMLQRKLSFLLPQLVSQPQLFSNLMHEVMIFDTAIQEEWNYTPLSPSIPWRGLAHHILEKQSYFARWLAVERDFALSRYDAIISDRSSGELDYDSVSVSSTKPSKAALRVNDLLETITDRYRTLSSFSQKLRFLIDIQIAIFDRFHQRLHESLEAYLTRTSTVARTVHGVSRDDQADLTGVKGLDRLCRVFGSAEYLEKAMRDWSDDVFFLELWEELQYRASAKVPIKGDLRMSEIASKTSSSIGGGTAEDDDLQGALFDETAASYQRLRLRSEGIISDMLIHNVRDALRPYTRINPWASLSSTGSGAGDDFTLTAELDATITILDTHLAFLSRALAKAPLKRIARQLAHAGAAQFVADVEGVCSVLDRYLGNGFSRTGMRRLCEGLILLGLPVRGEIPVHGDEEMDGTEQNPKIWGLFEVERRVFIDNEAARDVLEEMGLEVLSEQDARTVLERRVELSS